MLLFNTKDNYEGVSLDSPCSKGTSLRRIFFYSNHTDLSFRIMDSTKTKYIYLTKSDMQNNNLDPKWCEAKKGSLKCKNDTNEKDPYFYAYATNSMSNVLNENSQSIAVLFEVTQNDGTKKYAYIPSDLQNSGVSLINDKDNGFVYWYGCYNEKNVIGNSNITFNSNKTISVKVPKFGYSKAETNTSEKVRDYIEKSNLKNLVIYQNTHHGINSAPKAIKNLNLNRPDVYAVTSGSKIETNKIIYQIKSNYSTLSKTTRLSSGEYENVGGVQCYINGKGNYECRYYCISNRFTSKNKTLTFGCKKIIDELKSSSKK